MSPSPLPPVEFIELGALGSTRDVAPKMVELYGKGYRLKSTVNRGSSVLFTLEHTSQRVSRRLPRPSGPKPSQVDNAAFLKALGG